MRVLAKFLLGSRAAIRLLCSNLPQIETFIDAESLIFTDSLPDFHAPDRTGLPSCPYPPNR
ncbi:MAG: hypothetical protein CMJ46_15935 [Planctomyces sp.]|nr:hypothetical protein [Planctomyces sp.]